MPGFCCLKGPPTEDHRSDLKTWTMCLSMKLLQIMEHFANSSAAEWRSREKRVVLVL